MAAEHREVVHERDEMARSLADTSTAAAQHMEKATRQDITGKHPAEVMAYISEALSSSLNNIVDMTRQLKEDRSGNVSPKQAEYAGIIYKSGSDLLNLVNDIAYLSEAEAWNTELVFEQVKIKDVAYTIGQVFGPLSKEHNIKFSIHIQNVTDRITTDKTQLEEIIRHLLFNAFKFTPEEGEVKLIFAVHDQSLEIAVSDTGIGIPADEQLLIIENFRRPMGSRSRIPGAKGKGLQISNELARRMNGEIKIWSKINEGSTFTVMLPLDGGILATKQIRN
jgi:signal transduction histidine kinase